MSRFVRVLVTVSLLLSALPMTLLFPPRTAYALDTAGVTEVVTSLQSLGTVVNSLSGLAGLGQPVPFTDVDPSKALALDKLFGRDRLVTVVRLSGRGTVMRNVSQNTHGNV